MFSHHHSQPTPFRPRSNYTPPASSSNPLENYIYALNMGATRLRQKNNVFQNLNMHQRQALHQLSRNEKIVINKADKGSTIVILDKQDYMEKGVTHLSDHQTYEQLQHDTTAEVATRVVSCIRTTFQDGFIDKPTTEYLLPPNPVRTQELYF